MYPYYVALGQNPFQTYSSAFRLDELPSGLTQKEVELEPWGPFHKMLTQFLGFYVPILVVKWPFLAF